MVEIKKITYTDSLRQGTDKINSNFETVVDEIKVVDDRIDTIIVGGGPDKDPELVDIRNLDPSYTAQREINTAGDVTRDMQAQFVAHKADFEQHTEKVFNVKGYGAVGDNLTDDTEILQSILNLAKTTPIKVLIPSGDYKITSKLTIYSNTHLVFESGARFIRHHNQGMIVSDYSDEPEGYEGVSNIIIEGGIFDSNYPNFQGSCTFIELGHGSKIRIKDTTFINSVNTHCLDLIGTTDVIVEGCSFKGFIDVLGTRNFSEAIQLSLATEVAGSGSKTYDGTPTQNVTIRNCYFGMSGTTGTQAWPVGIGDHSAVHDIYVNNIHIHNNTFDGCTYAAIHLFKFKDTFIHNNLFTDCNRGIAFDNVSAGTDSSKDIHGVQTNLPQSGENLIVSDNIFRNIESDFIYVFGQVKDTETVAKVRNIKIKGNVFDNSQGTQVADVKLRWIDGLSVSHNSFHNTFRGIQTQYVSNAFIGHNDFSKIQGEAVHQTESVNLEFRQQGFSNNISVCNNNLRDIGRTGILIEYVSNFNVSENYLFDVANLEDNLRAAITCGQSSNGKIFNNKIVMGGGNKNRFGIWVTATVNDVQLFNNDVEGKTASVNNLSTTTFDGIFIHSPNGSKYRMTVSDSGEPTFTLV